MFGSHCKCECQSRGVWVTMTLLLRIREAGGDSRVLWSPQEVLWVSVTQGDAHIPKITFTRGGSLIELFF